MLPNRPRNDRLPSGLLQRVMPAVEILEEEREPTLLDNLIAFVREDAGGVGDISDRVGYDKKE